MQVETVTKSDKTNVNYAMSSRARSRDSDRQHPQLCNNGTTPPKDREKDSKRNGGTEVCWVSQLAIGCHGTNGLLLFFHFLRLTV